MNDTDWYEVTEGPVLLQGDILRRCPVFFISGNRTWPVTTAMQVDMESSELDLVVMTQSCDLDNDKVEDVLLARMTPGRMLSARRSKEATTFSNPASSADS